MFWPCWVFVAALGFSLVAASRGCSLIAVRRGCSLIAVRRGCSLIAVCRGCSLIAVRGRLLAVASLVEHKLEGTRAQ